MRRIHIALAVDSLEESIADYTGRLGAEPLAVVPGRYALWRTPEVNLSINADTPNEQRLRHLGFEDDSVGERTEDRDVNGIAWETFNPTWQSEGVLRVYGPPVTHQA